MNTNYQITPKQRTDIRTSLISTKVILEHVSLYGDMPHLKEIINENIQKIDVAINATNLQTLWDNEDGYDVKRQSERRVIEREAYEAARG